MPETVLDSILFGLLMAGISALCWMPITWLAYRVMTPRPKSSYARFTSWCVFIWIWMASIYATASVVAMRSEENGTSGDLAGLIPGAMCGYGPVLGLAVSIPLGMWLRRRRGWGRPVPVAAAPAPYTPPPARSGPTQVVQHITIVNQINIQQSPPPQPQPPEASKPARKTKKLKRKQARGEIGSKPDPRYDLDESEIRYWTDDD